MAARLTAEYGEYSTYTLAERIGMSQGTAHKLLSPGPRMFHERTLQNVAVAFNVDIREVRVMAGQPAGEFEPFHLPDEVNQLNDRERAAVREMALVILEARGRWITR